MSAIIIAGKKLVKRPCFKLTPLTQCEKCGGNGSFKTNYERGFDMLTITCGWCGFHFYQEPLTPNEKETQKS